VSLGLGVRVPEHGHTEAAAGMLQPIAWLSTGLKNVLGPNTRKCSAARCSLTVTSVNRISSTTLPSSSTRCDFNGIAVVRSSQSM